MQQEQRSNEAVSLHTLEQAGIEQSEPSTAVSNSVVVGSSMIKLKRRQKTEQKEEQKQSKVQAVMDEASE